MPAASTLFRTLLLAALPAAVAGSALAQDAEPGGSGLRFNGYGTLGLVQAHATQPWGFVRDNAQPSQGSSLRPGVDSRLGLQLNWTLRPEWELVGQLVLRREDPAAEFVRRIDWAFVAWRPDPAWVLRLGRTAPDMFMLADHRSVGYAYPWARPSIEFYGWMPMQTLDGADAMRRWRVGEAEWQLRLGTGRTSTLLGASRDATRPASDPPARVDLRGLLLATLTHESGGLTLKATFVRSRFTVTDARAAAVSAGLQQLAALGVPGVSSEAAGMASELAPRDGPARYTALGARYEAGPWTLWGEISRVSAAKGADGLRGYLSAGYRVGALMPYAMLGQARAEQAAQAPPTHWAAALTPLLGAAAAEQMVALGSGAALAINAARFDQRTLALGLRWDLHPQAALKLQWEQVRVSAGGAAAWAQVRSFEGARARVLSASIDFVF